MGSDHRGFKLKEEIKNFLAKRGSDVEDFGCYNEDSVDYPEFGIKVVKEVKTGRFDRGILFCGSGIGMSITANKVQGIRAALVWNKEMARMSYEHNKADILCLPADFISLEEAKILVEIWLDTPFAGGRHKRRIDLIDKLVNKL